MSTRLKVMVVGCGNMGSSHAKAYHSIPEFDLVGLVDRFPEARGKLAKELGGVAEYDDYEKALADAKPDCVAICTYPDTHAELTLKAFAASATVVATGFSTKTWQPAANAFSVSSACVSGYVQIATRTPS